MSDFTFRLPAPDRKVFAKSVAAGLCGDLVPITVDGCEIANAQITQAVLIEDGGAMEITLSGAPETVLRAVSLELERVVRLQHDRAER